MGNLSVSGTVHNKDADLALAVQAKREVGMLYDDIVKAPYTKLFNPELDASAMWRAVLTMRVIDRIQMQ